MSRNLVHFPKSVPNKTKQFDTITPTTPTPTARSPPTPAPSTNYTPPLLLHLLSPLPSLTIYRPPNNYYLFVSLVPLPPQHLYPPYYSFSPLLFFSPLLSPFFILFLFILSFFILFFLYLVLITPHHHHFAAFSKVDVFFPTAAQKMYVILVLGL